MVERAAPSKLVLRVAQSQDVGLIVTGMARTDPLERMLTGTTADEVLRVAAIPVLVVRQRARQAYRKILVATDLSACSRAALRTALRYFRDPDFTLFHTFDVPYAGFVEGDRRKEAFAAGAWDECSQFLVDADLPDGLDETIRVVVEQGSKGWLLHDYVRHANIDLVVLGTHGRGRLMDLILGSTASWIMQFTPCDVMLVPKLT